MSLRLSVKPLGIYITLSATIIISIFVAIVSFRIDTIINVDLYSFHLQFDPVWYNSYSLWSKLLWGSLGVMICLNAAVLGLNLFREFKSRSSESPIESVADKEQAPNIEPASPDENAVVSSFEKGTKCSKCEKVVVKPVSKLDFVEGKPIIKIVCPSCGEPMSSYVLEAKEETQTEKATKASSKKRKQEKSTP